MAKQSKPRGADAKLLRLRTLRHEPPVPEHADELRKFLTDKSEVVVEQAAELVGDRKLADLAPNLVSAFERFINDKEDPDTLCRTKCALLVALNRVDYDEEAIFLRALRHVRIIRRGETYEDVAAPLRGIASFGLVRMNHPRVLLILAELLADSAAPARLAAVQALGDTRSSAAIPLLRYKALCGDSEADVTAECMKALMQSAPKESIEFVARFLDSKNVVIAEGAAFALGESRESVALDALKAHWPQTRSAFYDAFLLAIATTRLPAAPEFLLEVLANTPAAQMAALSALAIHRHNDKIKDRVAAIVANQSEAVRKAFQTKFAAG